MTKRSKKKTHRIIWVVVAVILLTGVGVVAYMLYTKQKEAHDKEVQEKVQQRIGKSPMVLERNSDLSRIYIRELESSNPERARDVTASYIEEQGDKNDKKEVRNSAKAGFYDSFYQIATELERYDDALFAAKKSVESMESIDGAVPNYLAVSKAYERLGDAKNQLIYLKKQRDVVGEVESVKSAAYQELAKQVASLENEK